MSYELQAKHIGKPFAKKVENNRNISIVVEETMKSLTIMFDTSLKDMHLFTK